MKKVLIIVLVFRLMTYKCEELVLEGCEYEDLERTYLCKDITRVFPNQFYGHYNLRCVNCNITNFTNRTFRYDNELDSFNASYSGIRHISSFAFSKFISTEFLYLDRNEIAEVDENSFSGMKQLYELHLEFNELKSLKMKFLNNLVVSSVYLNYNKLEEVSQGVFNGSIGLLFLDLSHNRLSRIRERSFFGLESLEILHLQNNEIRNLSFGSFSNLKNLRLLNLAHNDLHRLTFGTFSGMKYLNELNLSNNKIKMFNGDFLLSLPTLRSLDISSNEILNVDDLDENAPLLKFLKIDGNMFTCDHLKMLVRKLRKANVEIDSNSQNYNVQNIMGIGCCELTINENTISSYEKFYALIENEAKKYH